MLASLNSKPTYKNLFILFFITFIIRASVFYFYIQHESRYHQADSLDYHAGALFIALGHGMHNPSNDRPIFWRTPGYPAYLASFYKYFGVTGVDFDQNSKAQKASIWVQILISSILPILIFYLALLLLGSLSFSWISAYISAFHIGFILSSTYILTEGLATVFFAGFLILFFKAVNLFVEPTGRSSGVFFEALAKKNVSRDGAQDKFYVLKHLISAAILLAIYTWIRPMGQTLAIVSAILILLFKINKINIKKNLYNSGIFLLVFFACISPWYVRNYNLTGKAFFFPVFGPYLTCFCAPKIHSKINNIELIESHKLLTRLGGHFTYQAIIENQKTGKNKYVCHEIACLPAAMPLIKEHPFLFARDWIVEVCKTTFDLYSSQLVAFATNCYKFDPLIEYLDEKIKNCLYSVEIPIWMRLIAWLELIFSMLIWLGIFFGIILFMMVPILNRKIKKPEDSNRALIWLYTGIIFISTVILTGGFGYARLRLPVEALIIIMSLSFWEFAYKKLRNSKIS